MAPQMQFRIELGKGLAEASTSVGLAWINQASRRHRRFGPKSAPRHRDFGPGKVGVN